MEDRANKTPTPTGGKERSYSKDRPMSVESGGKDKKSDKKSAKSKRSTDKPVEEPSKKGGKAAGGGATSRSQKVTVETKEVKAKPTPGTKGTKREKKGADDDNHDIPEIVHPLLESIERREDEIWVLGNRVLLNLNVSRNKIGEDGLKAMLEAVNYQIEISEAEGKSGPGYGLIRLCVQRQLGISPDHDLYSKIEDAMSTRNPFQKPPTPSPSNDEPA